jgi:hypothetical protein
MAMACGWSWAWVKMGSIFFFAIERKKEARSKSREARDLSADRQARGKRQETCLPTGRQETRDKKQETCLPTGRQEPRTKRIKSRFSHLASTIQISISQK